MQARTISIHAPRTGSDKPAVAGRGKPQNFNPRSPHGERRLGLGRRKERKYFNPRSPHGERLKLSGRTSRQKEFQSTLPARGATQIKRPDFPAEGISIHAPRTGSDQADIRRQKEVNHISIHAPRTGSDRAAARRRPRRAAISIHAPRTGSDCPFRARSPS